jgi:hypothetical protein
MNKVKHNVRFCAIGSSGDVKYSIFHKRDHWLVEVYFKDGLLEGWVGQKGYDYLASDAVKQWFMEKMPKSEAFFVLKTCSHPNLVVKKEVIE